MRYLPLILAAVCLSASAIKIELTDAEQQTCKDEGGCAFVTQSWAQQKQLEAFKAGIAEGKKSCTGREL